MTVDTLKLSRTLQAEGDFAPKQAEAIAGAFGDADEMLVTKTDLRSAIADLQKEMAGLEVRIGDRISRALGLQTVTIIMAVIGGLYALHVLGR